MEMLCHAIKHHQGAFHAQTRQISLSTTISDRMGLPTQYVRIITYTYGAFLCTRSPEPLVLELVRLQTWAFLARAVKVIQIFGQSFILWLYNRPHPYHAILSIARVRRMHDWNVSGSTSARSTSRSGANPRYHKLQHTGNTEQHFNPNSWEGFRWRPGSGWYRVA